MILIEKDSFHATFYFSEVTFIQRQEFVGAKLKKREYHGKRFVLLRIDASGFESAVDVGDHVAILPQNSIFEVMRVILSLQCSAKDKKRVNIMGFEAIVSPEEALLELLDISGPITKTFLEKVLPKIVENKENAKASRLLEDKEAWKSFSKNCPRISDVFNLFPSLKVKFEEFVSWLQPIRPRWYSVSNAPDPKTKLVELLLSVHQFGNEDVNTRFGLCSRFLRDVKPGTVLRCLHQSKTILRKLLESKPEIPAVLIANGSGIAPLRAVWQVKSQNTMLFYGCRNRVENLFADETKRLRGFKRFTAYSRPLQRSGSAWDVSGGDEATIGKKEYVQDVVRRHRDELADIVLKKKGFVYICGNVSLIIYLILLLYYLC